MFFVFCYWKIIAALRRTAKVGNATHTVNIRQRNQQPAADGPSTSAAAYGATATSSSRSKPVNKTQKNVIKTMLAVTTCFIVCWFPVQFTIVVRLCGVRSFASQTLYYALVVIAFMNLVANPFIYATGLYQFIRVKCTALALRVTRRPNESQATNSIPT